MQATMGCVSEDIAGETDGVAISMKIGRDFIGNHHQLNIPRTTNHKAAFAVLGWFDRPELRQGTFWLRNFAKCVANPLQHFCLIKFTGHHQHGVIWLVVLMIKRLEVFNFDVFDIATVTNGGIAIVMPVVSNALQTLHENAAGRVFSTLILVADHGHFGVEIFACDVGIHHPVGFHFQCPLQIAVIGLE